MEYKGRLIAFFNEIEGKRTKKGQLCKHWVHDECYDVSAIIVVNHKRRFTSHITEIDPENRTFTTERSGNVYHY
jgi:hypothetical protein